MNRKIVLSALLLVLIGVLMQNLGKLPLIEDEALRALVAMEMDYQNDLITPTTGGEYYFNKPPLYNWVLLVFFKLFGYSNFVLRLPMVLSLLGFAATIFFYLKRHFSVPVAAFTTLFFITNGRMLFYESLHGLIDITFSWVVFLQIIVIYEYYRKGKVREMYLFSYGLAAIGFLLKGLPVVPFQGITLLLVLIMNKSFKTFFNRWHFAGVGLFLILTGSYFYAYYLKNPDQLMPFLENLVFQSSSRTLFSNSLWQGLGHIVAYPFELIFHFLPWSLLLLLLFNKQLRKAIRHDQRQWFFLLAVFFNLIIYWISPIVYPRYVIMLLPLAFAPLTEQLLKDNIAFVKKFRSWFEWGIAAVVILAIPATMVFNFLKAYQDVPFLLPKTLAIIGILTYLMFRFFKQPQLRMAIIVLVLIIGRMAYNTIVVEHLRDSENSIVVPESKRIAEITKAEPFFLYFDEKLQKEGYHGRLKHKYNAQFYLQLYYGDIIPVSTELKPDVFYLVSEKPLDKLDVEVYTSYRYHERYKKRYLVKRKKQFVF